MSSSTKLVGAAKKKDAERMLQNRPVLVLFYMIGCPHCQANEKAWNEAKRKVGGNTSVLEIDADATPDSAGVSGFPTMRYIDENGKKSETSGAKKSGDEILSELKVPPTSGGRRRRTGRRRTYRLSRKLRYRTLRNYIPFRK